MTSPTPCARAAGVPLSSSPAPALHTPAARFELDPGTTLAGFRVEALVGRGGMGAVYRATEEALGRKVALKVIAPELAQNERFRKRFLSESRIAASLDHPHVVPIYRSGDEGGLLFLAMRYVEGTDLAKLLAAERMLELRRALSLLEQVAEALDAAHAKGLVHRDVKPSNVLIAEAAGNEHCYLADFGLTKRTASLSGVSDAGDVLGTLGYVPPEQITGDEVDARSDVYSLGCVLYECLTGQSPFPRATDVALLWAHVHEEPIPLSRAGPELPPELDPVLARALAKDPPSRYRSAGDLIRACFEPGASGTTDGTTPRTNLPHPLSSFVGRHAELGEVLYRIEGGARLLTLTGPGGSGKTRLALEAAFSLVPENAAGVFWVGLAGLRDPTVVTETIAQTLGAKDGLAEHIRGRELLLVLDNLEQVIESAPELSSLLERCPNLTLLVTSRELLRVRGEVEYPVPPLVEQEAVELFCQRSGLGPSDEIKELCARLDSLPLALELAAARAKALSVAQILERLSGRLDLFRGARDADPRQQTLRATIEWSHDLLSEGEQRLFRRLSVFAGGCMLEAAEEVCDADADTLQSLLEKSLLRYSNARYSMLETIREYATDKLHVLEERDALCDRHAEHYFDLARRAETEFDGARQTPWLERVSAERDNLRMALDWSQQSGDHEAALRAALVISAILEPATKRGPH